MKSPIIPLLFILILLVHSCSNPIRNTCFPVIESECSLHFVDYLDEQNCVYLLNDFFGFDSGNYFYFNDGIGFIGNNREEIEPQALFSFKEPVGTIRKIQIRGGTWIKGGDKLMEFGNMEVEKIKQVNCQDDDRLHFILRNNMYHIEPDLNLNMNFVFSRAQGFVGSFLSDDLIPEQIVGLEGEIYENCFGYQNFSKKVIK